jgi:glutaredoxin
MTPKRIRLFIKPYCGWCHQAMNWLNQRGITYEVLDVIAHPKAYDEMVRLTRQTCAPVIEVDGQILADFGLPELEDFWAALSQKPTP